MVRLLNGSVYAGSISVGIFHRIKSSRMNKAAESISPPMKIEEDIL